MLNVPNWVKELCEEVFGVKVEESEKRHGLTTESKEEKQAFEWWAQRLRAMIDLSEQQLSQKEGLIEILVSTQKLRERIEKIVQLSPSPPPNVKEAIQKGVENAFRKAKATIQLQGLLNNVQYNPSKLDSNVQATLSARIRTCDRLESTEKGELLILLGLEPRRKVESLRKKAERELILRGWEFLNEDDEIRFLQGLIWRILSETIFSISYFDLPRPDRLFRSITRDWLHDILKKNASLKRSIEQITQDWDKGSRQLFSAYLEVGPYPRLIANYLQRTHANYPQTTQPKKLSDALGRCIEKLYRSLKKRRWYSEIIFILAQAWAAERRPEKGIVLNTFYSDLGYEDPKVFQEEFDAKLIGG